MSLIINGDRQWRGSTWLVAMVSRIREGSFDPWGKQPAGGDELLLFEMRPLIHRNGAFDLRALNIQEEEGAIVIMDPWAWPLDPRAWSHL